MKVLIVSSGNNGNTSSFVQEQGESLQKKGVEVEYFQIVGKGYQGYLANLSKLKIKISSFKPDLIHAHYGLTALLSNLQRKIPVISTFHGSDIWIFRKNRILSQLAHILSKQSIIVDEKMSAELKFSKKIELIPCGVDPDIFTTVEKSIAMAKMDLTCEKINILFSSNFEYYEKNYPLARKAMNILGDRFKLIELKGYSRVQVNLLLNACDVALMTSISEGSPQFIKEAMLCNCPIVSTRVGDVAEVIGITGGCYLTSFDPADIAQKVKLAVEYRRKYFFTRGRQRIMEVGLDSETIANRIIEVYKKVLTINA
jgi:teichuronic acid biosynthesis glycosyltransferase TuaC